MPQKHQGKANLHLLQRAVIIVYDRIDRSNEKSAAECWTLYGHPKAKQMVSWVRDEYKSITGQRCGLEAYIIADTYISFRKATTKRKLELRDDSSQDLLLVEMA